MIRLQYQSTVHDLNSRQDLQCVGHFPMYCWVATNNEAQLNNHKPTCNLNVKVARGLSETETPCKPAPQSYWPQSADPHKFRKGAKMLP